MTSRRIFLTGLMAATVAPVASWADLGAPAFLSAGMKASGDYALFGLTEAGQVLFDVSIPDRGHAACAHPTRPIAVGFARRPGRFAFVLDCLTGETLAQLHAVAGRHFYGHGTFSADGNWLFTTENDYDEARGVIGVYDVRADFTRVDEFDSAGVGPHDMRLMPSGDALVVANGGIETHPDAGRAKLNLPFMQPNLSYVALDGTLLEQIELDPALRLNSIRHLDVRADGLVGFAMQWQGDKSERPAILGLHQRGETPRLIGQGTAAAMNGYCGSVAFSRDGHLLAGTSPRGGQLQVFAVASGELAATHAIPDVCGLGASGDGFVASSGEGAFVPLPVSQPVPQPVQTPIRWDNHLIRIGA